MKRSPSIIKWAVAYVSRSGAVKRALFSAERHARKFYQALARRECQAQWIYPLPRPIRNGGRRLIGAIRFIADRPGCWFSECGHFMVLRTPANDGWRLYRQDRNVRGEWAGTVVFIREAGSISAMGRCRELRKTA